MSNKSSKFEKTETKVGGTEARRRNSYRSLIQVAGTVCVIAYHLATPLSNVLWAAVELFFVIAGLNMTKAFSRETDFWVYTRSRVVRLVPEISVVWTIYVILWFSGIRTPSSSGFIICAPFFIQNFVPMLGEFTPFDMGFVPLWFVAGLVQAQVILFLFRKFLINSPPSFVFAFSLLFGGAARICFIFALQDGLRSASPVNAHYLYLLPFTHIEALVFGLLVGRGFLKDTEKWFVPMCFLAIALGFLNLRYSDLGPSGRRSFGYPWPLSVNFQYVWGYPIIALIFAFICSDNNRIAVLTNRVVKLIKFENLLSELSRLSFGAYCFHGLIIAFGINGGMLFPKRPMVQILVLLITLFESYCIAWLFKFFWSHSREFGFRRLLKLPKFEL